MNVSNIMLPNFKNAERSFQINLERMMGRTDAITVDHMLECIVFINNNAVSELLFIEQGYLGSIFNNEEFLVKGKVNICSIQILVNRYEQAKKDNDIEFLNLFRIAHREARMFLDDVGVKNTLRTLLEKRRATVEYQAYMNIVSSIATFMRDFGYNKMITTMFSEFLSQLSAGVRHIEGIVHIINEEKTSGNEA
jgi:hypothetical protein